MGGLITANQFPEISASALAPGKGSGVRDYTRISLRGVTTWVVVALETLSGTGVVDAYDV